MDNARADRKLEHEIMDLFIFRTNIRRKSDFSKIRDSLLTRFGIRDCTIDLEDRDKVLRVECENVPIMAIVEDVVRHGFICEELAD